MSISNIQGPKKNCF